MRAAWQSASDVVPMVIVAAIILTAAAWRYGGWWLAIPLAVLCGYGMLWGRRRGL